VHQSGTQNGGEPEQCRLVAAFVGLESARQLATQLKLERISRFKIPRLQTLLGADDPIAISNVLVLTVFRRNAEERLPRTARTRAGNVIAAIWQLHPQKSNGHRIDIGTIASDRDR